jgi:hypothetical protein
MVRSSLFVAATLFIVSCTTAPDQSTGTGGLGNGGGKADAAATTLTFASDWSEIANGPLVAGSTIRVAYDLARLTSCRGSTGGSEVWGVGGFAQFDDGTTAAFAVSELQGGHVVPVIADLEIPAAATQVELWFQITNVWGCTAYDSNDSANYHFAIEHHGTDAVLAFDADFSESQSGALHAGDRVVVHYEPARLAQCAGTKYGRAAWGVTGYWQVDDGAVHTVAVSRADGAALVADDPTITLPAGHEVALWFEATSVWGCHAWDSDFGANYHATIE